MRRSSRRLTPARVMLPALSPSTAVQEYVPTGYVFDARWTQCWQHYSCWCEPSWNFGDLRIVENMTDSVLEEIAKIESDWLFSRILGVDIFRLFRRFFRIRRLLSLIITRVWGATEEYSSLQILIPRFDGATELACRNGVSAREGS